MKFRNITVIGLGLIGGSLCRALLRSGISERITGIDAEKSVVEYASYNGFVNSATTSFMRGVSSSEIVVIATHVDSVVQIAHSIYKWIPDGCIITDVGSVKEVIVRGIESSIPENISFVGGHPIAGTENSGITSSDPDLFADKRVFLTPGKRTPPRAVERIAMMWEAAGSTVSEIDPKEHDEIFALVSHLPHAVAYSLVNTVISSGDLERLVGYAGGGFRDFTRIASSSPEMWKAIFMMNRDNLMEAVRLFKNSLGEIEEALESSDAEKLLEILSRVREAGIKQN